MEHSDPGVVPDWHLSHCHRTPAEMGQARGTFHASADNFESTHEIIKALIINNLASFCIIFARLVTDYDYVVVFLLGLQQSRLEAAQYGPSSGSTTNEL
jgi:hypothetical protein